MRADYLDQVVWDHITGPLADTHLIQTEIDKRLHAARSADRSNRQRRSLELALAKAALNAFDVAFEGRLSAGRD